MSWTLNLLESSKKGGGKRQMAMPERGPGMLLGEAGVRANAGRRSLAPQKKEGGERKERHLGPFDVGEEDGATHRLRRSQGGDRKGLGALRENSPDRLALREEQSVTAKSSFDQRGAQT